VTTISRGDEVLLTATRIFAQRGYAGTSVQDLADELHMPKATLYHYIESKEDVLSKILARAAEFSQTLMRDVDAFSGTPIERLDKFVRGYVYGTLTNLDRTTVYSREWRYLNGDLQKSIMKGRRGLDKFLVRLIDDVKDAGVSDAKLDSKRIAFFVWGALSSLPDWYRRDGRETPDQVADTYAQMVLRLVLKPSARKA
jgi:AcrR family transcriptional regulator